MSRAEFGPSCRRIPALILLVTMIAGCRTLPIPAQDRFVGGCETPEHNMSAVWAPTWSPDGMRVAFFSALDSSGGLAPGIYIVDSRTRRTTLAYRDPYMNAILALQWSPRGRYLLASRGFALAVLDLTSGAMRALSDTHPASGGAWNWSGDSIYYTREMLHWYDPPESLGLYVASAADFGARPFVLSNGSRPMPLGPVEADPAGEWLAFSAHVLDSEGVEAHGAEIFIVRKDGSHLRQLTSLQAASYSPKWIEGGALLAFDSYPLECYASGVANGHTWVVPPGGGTAHPYVVDISDRNVQFCWPPGVDRTGWKVAATIKNPHNNAGELYTLDLRDPWHWRPLFTPPIDTSRSADPDQGGASH